MNHHHQQQQVQRWGDCPCEEDLDVSLLEELLDQQKFCGSWHLQGQLCNIIGEKIPTLRDKSPIQSSEVWATALAIAWMRNMHQTKRNEKSCCAERKAIRWLEAQTVELHTIEEIIHHALEVLLKHM